MVLLSQLVYLFSSFSSSSSSSYYYYYYYYYYHYYLAEGWDQVGSYE